MRRHAFAAGIGLVLGLAMVLASPGHASESYETARREAATSRDDMANGRFDEAQRRLSGALKRCEPEVEGRPCRLLLHYSLGYLYAGWADAVPERRDGALARSAAFYRLVLEETPGHAETINNLALVLRDLGQVDDLVSLRDRVMADDPALAARVVVVIGDSHAGRGDWRSAYQAYADAAKLDPQNESARQKLLDAYGQADAADTGDLLTRLRAWEARFPDLAADGYGVVVKADAAREGKLNERALLRWIALSAEQRTISSALVARQFAGLKLAPIDELSAFLKTVETIPPARVPSLLKGLQDYSGSTCIGASTWWLESLHRRNALAEAALALGRAAIVAKDAERAETSFILGVRCGPPSDEYMFGALREGPFVFLDIMTELAWLQARYPARDPKRKKLDAVVHALFEGKGEAYQANDLRAIERHHVVLGQIYAELGVWSGGGARNAIFQLSRAIKAAEQRAKAGDAYDPMPGLKTLLGEGYERTGDQAAAQASYVAAAQAYLDSDDIKRTTTVLARAKAVAPANDASAGKRLREIEATEKILTTRRDVKARERQGDKPSPAATWLPEAKLEGVSIEFLRRQQFKVNADLAAQATRQNDQSSAARYAKAAIESAREVKTLIGVDDLRRLERAGAAAKPAADRARPRVDLSYGDEAGPPDAKEAPSWKVRVPSASEPLKARLKE